MDPDVALAELRAAIEELKAGMREEASVWDLSDAADKVIVKQEALDSWLSRGGFLPRAWRQHG